MVPNRKFASLFLLRTGRGGFSLIEVVAAIAIFAIGMVAVLGLFAPVTKSVAATGEAEAASRVADAVRARLSALPFATARLLIQDVAAVQKNDANASYNPNDGKNAAVIYGKLTGEIGLYDDTTGRKDWRDSFGARVADADKFFEIDLIRNETLSPAAGDAIAPLIAYTLRVRWPAFLPTAAGTGLQVGATTGAQVAVDQSRKQVVYFTGTLTR